MRPRRYPALTNRPRRYPHCPAGALVQAWLDAQPLTRAALAARLDIAPPQLWLWMIGRRTPCLRYAFAIEDATGVDARAWLAVDEAPDTLRANDARAVGEVTS